MESAEDVAGRLGLRDVFALRRISDEQLVNLMGVGRGEGWAGNISIDPDREPLITRALETGEVVRHRDQATRVFGPYWAEEAVVLTVGDYVIVMGGCNATDHGDDVLMEAASDLAYSVGDVPAEKRLADELEVTKAALTVATLPRSTLDQFLSNVAGAAMEALGCEFGAVVLRQPEPRLLMAPSGWTPSASDDLILGSLLQLTVDIGTPKPVVAQDLRNEPSAQSPLGFDEGLVSRCIIPLSVTDVRGAIVVAHTMESAPRGFTNLCQLVAASIGDQATKMLHTEFAGEAVGSVASGPASGHTPGA